MFFPARLASEENVSMIWKQVFLLHMTGNSTFGTAKTGLMFRSNQ